jgi:hypothetical protein
MKALGWIIAAVLLMSACAEKQSELPKTALLSGMISVEGSSDLTGIVIDITFLGESLFRTETDIDGYFGGVVDVPQKGAYSMTISRNNRILHVGDLILAPSDTIRITGVIPRLAETFQVSSHENTAWATLKRMNRQFDRLIRIAATGVVTPDSVSGIVRQWSGLYWSIRDTYPGTFAAEQASRNSIDMLVGVDEALIRQRLEQLGNTKSDFATKLTMGAELTLSQQGLEPALAYVDGLKASTKDKELRISSDMRRVELMLMVGEGDRALSELAIFRKKQAGTDYDNWAESLQYELTNLVPGKLLPEFSVNVGADSITNASLKGKPYMIEFVSLTGGAYSAGYPDLVRLHRRVAVKGIRFITIPLDSQQALWDGFFKERRPEWTFAPIGAFAASSLVETLRIDRVPIRFLVGSDGLLIRRYFSYDTKALEADLTPLLTIPNF